MVKRLIGKIYYEENDETGFAEAFIVWSFGKDFTRTQVVDCITDIKNQSLRDMYESLDKLIRGDRQ